MNTPAHLLFGAALFARPSHPGTTVAAVLGALVPDLSLYLMATASIWLMGIPAERVFRELYFSTEWQAVFAVDNSIPLWGIVLAFALWRGRTAVIAFAAAGLLHVTCDLVLHNEDARRHFWPVSDWMFRSPVSYWDPRHHGQIVAPVEMALAILCTAWLWRRFSGWRARAFFAALLALELTPHLMFHYLL
ncbi:cobalamin biosynthesis protein CobQ [Frigidibacter sp. SD6-1]|uniref:cobalamin biosynthesis protein CobQ n=1 Tax=Frigidibacter sp. SD6-1 TaxID=3032581 RepID=UPI0024DF731F|nr:cobalamin biosynthesis protein CobQ [Frigidibacter sp. SD6-1]